MIRLHEDITMLEAARAADLLDCHLENDGYGDIVITPNSHHAAPQSNSNVTKMPRRKTQYIHSQPEQDPAA